MRRLLTPAFSTRRMHALRAHIAGLVETLLDQLAEQTPPADLHEALSFPLPVQVICELLGVPYADRDQFRAWSADAANLTDREAATAALGHLVSYMHQLTAHKRTHPGQDVISDPSISCNPATTCSPEASPRCLSPGDSHPACCGSF